MEIVGRVSGTGGPTDLGFQSPDPRLEVLSCRCAFMALKL